MNEVTAIASLQPSFLEVSDGLEIGVCEFFVAEGFSMIVESVFAFVRDEDARSSANVRESEG
ncbi:hypothetical protein I4J43_06095 [Corynebacterium belfantii]|uniref:hypothetical protein n=1 Tax=Corynebacterium belfantii TaxID=2014537 RepID=UPI0018D40F61|nr:hypothetical protein [Corynebacterium belfantii]MBG9243808.1 hypothetical protein [Corynebacterium belfantii]